jgi:hypothetical protein
MLIEAREGSVDPDYFQFYVKTPSAEWASAEVTELGYEAHLEAPSQSFIYVGTLKKFSDTPVRVEVHDSEPSALSNDWLHAAEVSFVGDERLEVVSWNGDVVVTIQTTNGPLRLRAAWAGLEPELIEEGRREDGTSDERILLQIWPAPLAERRILRWWSEWERKPPSGTAPDGRRQIDGLEGVMESLASGLRRVPVDFTNQYGRHPPMPGGDTGQCVAIWGDPRDGTWWIDGYDERRTLRTATPEEVRNFLPDTVPTVMKDYFRYDSEPRWDAMLESIGLRPDSG